MAILPLLVTLCACATPNPAPLSQIEPPIDMRYLAAEPPTKKTVCVEVDTTASGGPARAKVFRTPIVEQFAARDFSVLENCQRAYVRVTYTLPPKFLAHVTSAGQPVFTDGATTTAGMALGQARSIMSEGYPAGYALASIAAAFGALQKDAIENRRQAPYYIVVGDLNIQLGDGQPQYAQVRATVPDKALANPRDMHELTVAITQENASTIVRTFAP